MVVVEVVRVRRRGDERLEVKRDRRDEKAMMVLMARTTREMRRITEMEGRLG